MTRQETKEKIQNLYKSFNSNLDKYYETAFQIIKQNFQNKDKLNEELNQYLYDLFTNVLSITLTEIKQIYSTYDENKKLDIKNLLYNKDNLILENRVSKWINETKTEIDLLYHISLIINTEVNNLIRKATSNKVEEKYIEIFGCDCCDNCSTYYGIFPIDELEAEPPYHPGCHCIAIGYEETEDEVKGDL